MRICPQWDIANVWFKLKNRVTKHMILHIFKIIIIVLTAIFPAYMFVRRKKVWLKIISIVVFAMVLVLVSVAHFENIFYKCDTPEMLFEKLHSSEIFNLAYGDNSAVIIYETEKGQFSYDIYVKTSRGYRNTYFWEIGRETYLTEKSGILVIYHVKPTNEIYLDGMVVSDTQPIVEDNFDSVYSCRIMIENDGLSVKTYSVLGYLKSSDNNYCLTINGEVIELR